MMEETGSEQVFSTFSLWLAISFLLVNPPLADIAPPTLANGIDVQNTDSIEYAGMIDGTYTIALNQGTVDVVLGMAVRDNVDAENATVQVSFWKYGALVGELANGTASDLTEARAIFELTVIRVDSVILDSWDLVTI